MWGKLIFKSDNGASLMSFVFEPQSWGNHCSHFGIEHPNTKIRLISWNHGCIQRCLGNPPLYNSWEENNLTDEEMYICCVFLCFKTVEDGAPMGQPPTRSWVRHWFWIQLPQQKNFWTANTSNDVALVNPSWHWIILEKTALWPVWSHHTSHSRFVPCISCLFVCATFCRDEAFYQHEYSHQNLSGLFTTHSVGTRHGGVQESSSCNLGCTYHSISVWCNRQLLEEVKPYQWRSVKTTGCLEFFSCDWDITFSCVCMTKTTLLQDFMPVDDKPVKFCLIDKWLCFRVSESKGRKNFEHSYF